MYFITDKIYLYSKIYGLIRPRYSAFTTAVSLELTFNFF